MAALQKQLCADKRIFEIAEDHVFLLEFFQRGIQVISENEGSRSIVTACDLQEIHAFAYNDS